MARILVVDDEPDIIEIVRLRLEQNGHVVLSAPNGQAALMAAVTHKPDLVILDVMMPGLDGFEVLRRLKNGAHTGGVPVVMLTAKSDFPSVAQGWSLDADNYVTKPFQVDDLSKIVKDVLIARGRISEE
jgi:DNA-binding response OmpR family regulator